MERLLGLVQGGSRCYRVAIHSSVVIAVLSCTLSSFGWSGTPGTETAMIACNTLANNGPTITVTEVAKAAPKPLGGKIADGTYVLSALTVYSGPGGPTTAPSGAYGTYSGVFEISGNTMLQVGTVNGEEKRYAVTFTISGTTIYTNDTCPVSNSKTHSFSANATELRIYDALSDGSTLEQTITKK